MEIPVWSFVLLVISTIGFFSLLFSFLALVLLKCVRDHERQRDERYRRTSVAFYTPGQTTYIPLAVSYTAIQAESKLHATNHGVMNFPQPIIGRKIMHATTLWRKEPQSFSPWRSEDSDTTNGQFMLTAASASAAQAKKTQGLKDKKHLSDSLKSLTLYDAVADLRSTKQPTSAESSDSDDDPPTDSQPIESEYLMRNLQSQLALTTTTTGADSRPPSTVPTSSTTNNNDDLFISYDSELENTAKPTDRSVLNFSICYAAESLELIVLIKRAVDLPDSEELQEFYVCFCVVPEDFLWQKTGVQSGNRDPIFNEEFHINDILHHKLREYSLCFMVMRVGQLRDRVVGRVLVHLSELRADTVVDMWRELKTD